MRDFKLTFRSKERNAVPVQTEAHQVAEPLVGIDEDELALAAKECVQSALRAADATTELIRATDILHATADATVSRVKAELAQSSERFQQVACCAGCGHCCRMPVSIHAYEAVAIADHVRRTWSKSEVRRLMRRIDRCLKINAKPSTFAQREPCPFLKEGSCSIYEQRPTICRTHNSFNLDECLSHPMRKPSGSGSFYVAMDPIFRGGRAALGRQADNLAALDLAASVGIALRNPEAANMLAANADPFVQAARKRFSNVTDQ